MNEGEELQSSLVVPNGHTKVYFQYESEPEYSILSGGPDNFLCANIVTGTISFAATSSRYYRPSFFPHERAYEITLYESTNSNGVPAHPSASVATISELKRHCRFYPSCTLP